MIDLDNPPEECIAFFQDTLQLLHTSGSPFLVGGALAMFHYTGIIRPTKDLDIFCKSSEYPNILKHFAASGYQTELTDVRWLAKIHKAPYFIDIIFDSVNHNCTVEQDWYERAPEGILFHTQVRYVPAEELVWCKLYVQNRERHDSADINHLWLRYGKQFDWDHLLMRMDQHWHLLLAQLIIFQFTYPHDYRDIIPRDLFEELIKRAQQQYELPPCLEKVCLGPLIDQTQYQIDIKEWEYKSYTIKTV